MPEIGELIDRGIRAYLQGKVADARAAFEDALRQDPANVRARSYMVLIGGGAAPAPAAPAAPDVPDVPDVPDAGGSAPPSAGDGAPARAAPANGPGAGSSAAPPVRERDEYAPSPWDDGPAAPATFVLEAAGGLDLEAIAEKSDLRPLVPDAPRSPVPQPAARNDVAVWMQAARELHALGDFSGSLELIEKILQLDGEHAEAREYLRHNEATLVAMYESKLGALSRIPRLAIKPEEIMWLNLDHRAGFLLAQIDGAVDFESLFALSGLPRLDTARILATLMQEGVIRS